MKASIQDHPLAIAMMAIALLGGAPIIGLIAGGVGAMIPFLMGKVIIMIVAAYVLLGLAAQVSPKLGLRLLVALPAGLLAVAGFWFGWLWELISLEFAKSLFLAGPVAVWDFLSLLSQDFSYSYSRRSTEIETDQTFTIIIWAVNAGALFFSPLWGAVKAVSAKQVARSQPA